MFRFNSLKNIILKVFSFIVLVLFISNCSGKKEEKKKNPLKAKPEIFVEIEKVSPNSLAEFISANGLIEAQTTVNLSTQIAAPVKKIFVSEGRYVNKFTQLIKLDCEDLLLQKNQSFAAYILAEKNLAKIISGTREEEVKKGEENVASAKSNLENASGDLQRMEQLYQDKVIAKQLLDTAKNAYTIALSQYNAAQQTLSALKKGATKSDIEIGKAELKRAKETYIFALAQLKKCQVSSPISGVVTKLNLKVGEISTPAMPFITIMNISSVIIKIKIPESQIYKIKKNLIAKVLIDALQGKTFLGKIEKMSSYIDNQTRSLNVEVKINNYNHILKPGMFAEVKVKVAAKKNVLTISKKSIINEDGKNFVFVVKVNKVKKQEVSLGIQEGNKIEVLQGLHLGDMVVKEGQLELTDGTLVKIKS